MKQDIELDVATAVEAVREAGLATATVTIQRFDGTKGDTGVEAKDDDANWDDLEDHVDLEAMAAPDIYMTNVTRSTERREAFTIAKENSWHVLLLDAYPDILQEDRAKVTRPGYGQDVVMEVRGVEIDSQGTMTRLDLRAYE